LKTKTIFYIIEKRGTSKEVWKLFEQNENQTALYQNLKDKVRPEIIKWNLEH
jgi:nitrogen regulatory protein PII-like uncharacterized protein